MAIRLPVQLQNTGGAGAQGGGRNAKTPAMRSASTKRSAPGPSVQPQRTGVAGGTPNIPLPRSGGDPPSPGSSMIPLRPPTGGPMAGGPGTPGLSTTPITTENTLRNKRINFDLQPQTIDVGGMQVGAPGIDSGQRLDHSIDVQSVMDAAMEAFRSNLPTLNQDLMDQTEGLAKRTSAMGRTGSGLFNRDTDELSDRARATRESLLGNLGFKGATTDASNSLAAQIQQQQLREAQEGRFQRGSIAGAQNALQAALANQNVGLQGQMFNANNAMQTGLERLGLAERQQGREDRLAGQAQNDLATQLGLLQQGFTGNPANTDLQGAGIMGQLAGLFGNNATQTGGQVSDASSGITGLVQGLLGGGGGIPDAPPPVNFTPPPLAEVMPPGRRI